MDAGGAQTTCSFTKTLGTRGVILVEDRHHGIKMSHYPTSTQKTRWSFDAPTLECKRRESNKRVIDKVRESYRLAAKPSPDMADEVGCTPPTVVEEAKILKYYARQLLALCSSFQFPHKVHGTAILYFKRFYVHNSVIEHHPKGVMLTCIYLACKCEENYISMEQFARGASQNLKEILIYIKSIQ